MKTQKQPESESYAATGWAIAFFIILLLSAFFYTKFNFEKTNIIKDYETDLRIKTLECEQEKEKRGMSERRYAAFEFNECMSQPNPKIQDCLQNTLNND